MMDYIIERIKKSPYIDNSIIEFITTEKEKYVYGASLQASVMLGIFKDININIDGILLSSDMEKQNLRGYWGENLSEKDIYYIDLLSDEIKSQYILICVDKSKSIFCKKYLKNRGFKNLFLCEWERNKYFKDICFDYYMKNINKMLYEE